MKIYLLKRLFSYEIGSNVKIGRAIINCKDVSIGDNVSIGNRNTFSCKSLKIGANTKIFSGNLFLGNGEFSIGENSRIINNHFFDLYNNIALGNNTWVAGRDSQFWTHGSIHTKTATKDLSIKIENNVYIGSASRFAPGTKLSSTNLVGLGSIVSGNFNTTNTIIMGNPAKIVKQDIDWRQNW
ncbi:acyltransferase [Seonamhaeicola marinus]|uniref:Acyltransferase n=1 Tax=Seonamhaeicola marinus TaxID=1912246 RepID=A0A5D0HN11_9FLAO|nr:hypothetical protein [Seonamhaeicola marinus]TYA71417.1 hypothetical protein FUA24_17690 [Seonamhaeicola marinus]